MDAARSAGLDVVDIDVDHILKNQITKEMYYFTSKVERHHNIYDIVNYDLIKLWTSEPYSLKTKCHICYTGHFGLLRKTVF
jgi:hypothetical protein